MVCRNCNENLPEGTSVCTLCGKDLNVVPDVVPDIVPKENTENHSEEVQSDSTRRFIPNSELPKKESQLNAVLGAIFGVVLIFFISISVPSSLSNEVNGTIANICTITFCLSVLIFPAFIVAFIINFTKKKSQKKVKLAFKVTFWVGLVSMIIGVNFNTATISPNNNTNNTANNSSPITEEQPVDESNVLVEEETDLLTQEEADKLAQEEADKLAQEEADKLAQEEADKLAQEEADKLAQEEADKKAQEEADKKAQEEADKKAQEKANQNTEVDDVTLMEYRFFHKQYTDVASIQIHNFSQRRTTIEKCFQFYMAYKAGNETNAHLVKKETKLFSTDYLKKTLNANEADYIYIGEMKDNKPHGYGLILSGGVTGSGFIEVMGEFEKGYLEGYAVEFGDVIYPFSESDVFKYSFAKELSETDILILLSISTTPVTLEGIFEDGELNGKANFFSMPLRTAKFFSEPSQLPVSGYVYEVFYPNIIVGECEDGKFDGDVISTISNIVSYQGEMEKDEKEGYGTEYFLNSNQIFYQGEYKNGKFHGTGTLYNEDGMVKYKGEWKNGDVA